MIYRYACIYIYVCICIRISGVHCDVNRFSVFEFAFGYKLIIILFWCMYQSFSICFYFSNTTFVKDKNTQCQKRYLEWIPRWKIQFFRTKNVLKESVIFCPGKNFNTTCDISVATLLWTNYSPEIQNFVEFPFFLWGRPCKIFFLFPDHFFFLFLPFRKCLFDRQAVNLL